MIDNTTLIILTTVFGFVSQSLTVVVGYLSLRHKATLENVIRLEGTLASMETRMKSLETDHAHCTEDRRRLLDAKIITDEENARLKIELAAKDAAALVRLTAKNEALEDKLDKNNDMTAKTAENVEAVMVQLNKLDSVKLKTS